MAKKDKKIEEKKEVSILLKRVTEKSGIMSGHNAYTFKVPVTSNKTIIMKAFKNEYKKDPVKVSIINLPTKPVSMKGKPGRKGGMKKAIIFLKKGEKIEFM